MTSHSELAYLGDFRSVGFYPEQIAAFLRGHGVEIGDATNAPQAAATTPVWPEWKRGMALLPILSVDEAAAAFADVDPHDGRFPSDEEHQEMGRWHSILSRNGLPDAEGNINPARLAAWCDKTGQIYPLPRLEAAAAPTTDPELRDALAEARRAASEWEAETRKLRAENADLRRAAEQSKAGDIDPRQRETMLRVIAGVVSEKYGADTLRGKGGRLPDGFMDSFRADLGRHLPDGDLPAERTLRDLLKTAGGLLRSRLPSDE